MNIAKSNANIQAETIFISIIFAVSCGHFLDDVMQSMLPAIYPILRENHGLIFLQIGVITAVFQLTGSILQPIIGFDTDKKPSPYSLPCASAATMIGLLLLTNAHHYYILLIGSIFFGLGASTFHPEASRCPPRVRRKIWVAQSIFQVGNNCGLAIGPVIAALFIS